jgi:hypothetical protein
LGEARIDDIIANVLLPFLAGLAEHTAHDDWREEVRQAWLLLPRLQDNRVLEEAAHRLFAPPSRVREVVRSACEQQGLMQVYRDFCVTVHHNCKICPLRAEFPFDAEFSFEETAERSTV